MNGISLFFYFLNFQYYLILFFTKKKAQLGLTSEIEKIYEPVLLAKFDGLLSICCGSQHSFVLTSESLYGFGVNDTRQVGIMNQYCVYKPQIVMKNEGIASIISGANHSLLLMSILFYFIFLFFYLLFLFFLINSFFFIFFKKMEVFLVLVQIFQNNQIQNTKTAFTDLLF